MTVIILAAALGATVISIVVVLLFRRVAEVSRRTAEMDEAVRQLTDTDVELFRELVRLRRQMNGGPTVGREPELAAVANGGGPEPPSAPTQQPVRRKRHLVLYLGGGTAAAVAALSRSLHEAYRTHRGYVVGTAISSAAVATATVTVLTVAPWDPNASREPPSSAPTAAPTLTAAPPGEHLPPVGTQLIPSAPPSAPRTGASATPSPPAPSSRGPTFAVIPIGLPASASGSLSEPGTGGGSTSPGSGPGGTPAEEPPAAAPSETASTEPPLATPTESALCLGATAGAVLDAGVCVPGL